MELCKECHHSHFVPLPRLTGGAQITGGHHESHYKIPTSHIISKDSAKTPSANILVLRHVPAEFPTIIDL
jgi:hypothetical protein